MRHACGIMSVMSTPTGFHLIQSNALDVLAQILGTRLLADDADIMQPQTIVIGQYAMRRWLQQSLAEQLGIAANLRFLTPGEFVEQALDANLGASPDGARLRPEVMRWQLFALLGADAPAEYAGYLQAAGDATEVLRRRWSLACALAQSFERHQAWRRDVLLRWEDADVPENAQAALWRVLARGHAHRARRIDSYLQTYGKAGRAPTGLPASLHVFACQNVSPDVLRVLASQAASGEQAFYLHSPSEQFWGDAAGLDASGEAAQGDHPLLSAWGRAGREFVLGLRSGEITHLNAEVQASPIAHTGTLLGRIQQDILENRVADASGWPRAQVDIGDSSLQFHDCHTRLREVQVLHDQLRALLEAPASQGREPLQSRDIAVLAPDIDVYAPHIEAVFGGALGTDRAIPYTIADTRPLTDSPLAQAFVKLLGMPLQPPTLADVLDLLRVPAIGKRFAVDEAGVASLQTWLTQAGARRGLDGDELARHDDGLASDAYTFAFALQRLLLGHATGSDACVHGVAPLPVAEGQSTEALNALLRLLQTLRTYCRLLSHAHTPEQWAKQLLAMLEALVAEPANDSPDAALLQRLRKHINALADSAAEADFNAPVELPLIREQLLADLDSEDARAPFLSGGVCFGRMVPMRLIPFQVICVLGLDEAAFPGRDARSPLDAIAQDLVDGNRKLGDPSRRDADRWLFLQLLTSAGRTFYMSWQGQDARDGSRREPSAVVSELLQAAAARHDHDAETVTRQLVVRHALHPFSPAALGAPLPDESAAEPRRFSFDARWQAATQPGGTLAAAPAFADAVIAAPDAGDRNRLNVADLQRSLSNLPKHFLQRGLQLQLPEAADALPEHEPLGPPDNLGRWALRNALLQQWLSTGSAPDEDALHRRWLAEGRLPVGSDGLLVVQTLLADVKPFADIALDAGFVGQAQDLTIDVQVGTWQLQGSLPGLYDKRLLVVSFTDDPPPGRYLLRARLSALLARLHNIEVMWLRREKKGASPQLVPVNAEIDHSYAQQALNALLRLRELASTRPLPWLPDTAEVYRKRMSKHDPNDTQAIAEALDKAADTWLGDGFNTFAEADNAVLLAMRGRDPFADEAPSTRAVFIQLADALEATFDGSGTQALEHFLHTDCNEAAQL